MISTAHSSGVERVPESMARYPSLVHMLAAAVRDRPEHTAIICGADEISFRNLGSAIAGLADTLASGVGDRVLILAPNSIECVVAAFGAMAAGCQAAPVNPFYTEAESSNLVAPLAPAAVVCVDTTAELAQTLAEAHSIPQVVNLSQPASSLAAMIAIAPDGLRDTHFRAPDDKAMLFYTGGTTGKPKGVNHLHRTLMATALLHCTVWPVDSGQEVILNVAPLFHIWGFGYGVLSSLYAQSTFVLIPRYEPDVVLEAMAEHAATIFGGGPAPIYMGLLGSERIGSIDFSSLKYCLSGGAPCSAELHRRWRDVTGCELFEGWGMSEGAPLCLNPLNGVRKVMSVGRPVPDTQIEVVDIDTGTAVLNKGESGEVRVRGPQVMIGYREEPEETALALRDGWLHTGDVGYIDDDGYLFLVDRKKDMVIVGGYNVYPREVDELLAGHPKAAEAAVVGRPHERLGEVIVGFIALKPGESMTEEEGLAYCKENLVKYKRPVQLAFVESLPRTPANKIDKIRLRQLAREIAGDEA